MEKSEKISTIRLAIYLNSLNCKTIKELSKKTYELRESGEDVPYVSVDGLVSPTKSQKTYQYLYNEKIYNETNGTVRTINGYTQISIQNSPEGLVIFVITKYRKEDDDSILHLKILYCNKSLTQDETNNLLISTMHNSIKNSINIFYDNELLLEV